MYLAESHHFYTSSAFWSVAAGVIVGVLSIAATIWVTLRAANPKRRLYYSITSDTPLLTKRNDLSRELRVTYGPTELNSPRIVTVQVTSRGSRDITRDAFDDDKPLCLDLGTPIVECVATTTAPSDHPGPACAIDGSKLLIGPSHLGRQQTTVFSLLVDGESPQIASPPQSLIDVVVKHGDAEGAFPRKFPRWLLSLAAGIGAATVILYLYWAINHGQTFVLPIFSAAVVGGSIGYAVITTSRYRD